MSLHRSGETQVGIMNPELSEKVDTRDLIEDIQKKKKKLQDRASLFPVDGRSVIGVMNLHEVFRNSTYLLERDRLALNEPAIISMLTKFLYPPRFLFRQ